MTPQKFATRDLAVLTMSTPGTASTRRNGTAFLQFKWLKRAHENWASNGIQVCRWRKFTLHPSNNACLQNKPSCSLTKKRLPADPATMTFSYRLYTEVDNYDELDYFNPVSGKLSADGTKIERSEYVSGLIISPPRWAKRDIAIDTPCGKLNTLFLHV